jgi:hypothetical protein
MPLPTLVRDYATIGGAFVTDWKSTWAGVRFPLGLNSENEATVYSYYGIYSADYDMGFVAADGSLFRFEPLYNSSFQPTYLSYGSDPVSAPPPRVGVFIIGGGAVTPSSPIQPVLDVEDLQQLDGESVSMTGTGYTIDSDSYTLPPYRQDVSPDGGDFVSVGKLYRF